MVATFLLTCSGSFSMPSSHTYSQRAFPADRADKSILHLNSFIVIFSLPFDLPSSAQVGQLLRTELGSVSAMQLRNLADTQYPQLLKGAFFIPAHKLLFRSHSCGRFRYGSDIEYITDDSAPAFDSNIDSIHLNHLLSVHFQAQF